MGAVRSSMRGEYLPTNSARGSNTPGRVVEAGEQEEGRGYGGEVGGNWSKAKMH